MANPKSKYNYPNIPNIQVHRCGDPGHPCGTLTMNSLFMTIMRKDKVIYSLMTDTSDDIETRYQRVIYYLLNQKKLGEDVSVHRQDEHRKLGEEWQRLANAITAACDGEYDEEEGRKATKAFTDFETKHYTTETMRQKTLTVVCDKCGHTYVCHPDKVHHQHEGSKCEFCNDGRAYYKYGYE